MCLLQPSSWKANCVWLTVTMIGRNLALLFGHSCYHVWEAQLACSSKSKRRILAHEYLASSLFQTADNSSGAIVWFNCSKKERQRGGEINKLSTESVIYRLYDKNRFLFSTPSLPPSLSLSVLLYCKIFKGWIMGWYIFHLWFRQWNRRTVISVTVRLIP